MPYKVELRFFKSRNCPKCREAEPIVRKVVDELKEVKLIEIYVEDEPEEALMYQVTSVPSIAIDEETIWFGEVPSETELREKLLEALK
ncbi:MAG: thioredoxin family protein [Candidatus Nanoarchaeia archaeon]|nr:thioredoxin family protein [Candidatus Haiyanarchaeum thermophilum]MCW1303301.1 thioredoxin family protein [Candidatus Haiyanarchaeum thermophilum]MCW1303967.1 thioredoxin family protein [Candidatus Haiyanarchaeum thermophilum]MCW1306460.1 thioredoxin family protein [Candidatus Haiyanarchaeum thermophilum]MCW1307242.1 thioredoxin family protein [Candidatus Haiyanarchaeum thermophilum]